MSCESVVKEMEEDAQVSIISRRLFLAMTGTMIDVKNKKLSMNIDDEKVEFNIPRAMPNPTLKIHVGK